MFKHVMAAALAAALLPAASLTQTQTPPASEPDTRQRLEPAQQIQQDLNEMDSLLNNMAAETAFIKDTNLSILLGSNYRMWSILLRDMRLQMELQKKREEGAGKSAPK